MAGLDEEVPRHWLWAWAERLDSAYLRELMRSCEADGTDPVEEARASKVATALIRRLGKIDRTGGPASRTDLPRGEEAKYACSPLLGDKRYRRHNGIIVQRAIATGNLAYLRWVAPAVRCRQWSHALRKTIGVVSVQTYDFVLSKNPDLMHYYYGMEECVFDTLQHGNIEIYKRIQVSYFLSYKGRSYKDYQIPSAYISCLADNGNPDTLVAFATFHADCIPWRNGRPTDSYFWNEVVRCAMRAQAFSMLDAYDELHSSEWAIFIILSLARSRGPREIRRIAAHIYEHNWPHLVYLRETMSNFCNFSEALIQEGRDIIIGDGQGRKVVEELWFRGVKTRGWRGMKVFLEGGIVTRRCYRHAVDVFEDACRTHTIEDVRNIWAGRERGILKELKDIPVTIVADKKVFLRDIGKTPLSTGKKSLWLTHFKGDFLKPCPATGG